MPTHYHYPEVLPSEEFSEFINQASIDLLKAKNFLDKAFISPELFFTESSLYLKSKRNIITSILESTSKKKDTLNERSFQILIADYLNQALNKWCETNNINIDLKILVRNPNSFPSIFAVYVNDAELIQFDIYDKWYGIQHPPEDINKIKSSGELEIKELLKIKELKNQQIKEAVKASNSRLSAIKSKLGILPVLFQYKKVQSRIDEDIDFMMRVKINIEKRLEDLEYATPIQMTQSMNKQEYLEKIRPFFESFSYREEKEKSKLY